MNRRKVLAVLLICSLFTLSGCHPLVADEEKPLSVYATFYPIYALTEPLVRNVPNLALRCLVQPQDGCLRSYELSDWDTRLLSTADAVIAGGRGLESFESGLFRMGEGGPAVSAVLYNLELMNVSRKDSQTERESHLDGPNPHLYMSIEGAKRMVESISAMLKTLDPGYQQTYIDNEVQTLDALDALKAEVLAIAGDVKSGRVILMNEALDYIARDYGLTIAGRFNRESGEALVENDLAACLETLNGWGACVVLIERQAPRAFTNALEAAGYAVAPIDILATGRAETGFQGYKTTQLNNARAIRRAFDREGAH